MGGLFARLPLLAAEMERKRREGQPPEATSLQAAGNLETQDLLREKSLNSLDYSSAAVCGGSPCVKDSDIYADAEKSQADDRVAEQRATERRFARFMVLQALEADVARRQRGTRDHRRALERLHAFKENGVLIREHPNMEGAPGPENIALGEMVLAAPIAAAFPVAATVAAGLTIGTSIGEAATGRSSGFMNPGRLLSGDFEIGRSLSVTERVAAGLTALAAIVGGVVAEGMIGRGPKIV